MRRAVLLIVLISILLTGCASSTPQPERVSYTATYLTLFDTLTTIKGFAESEAEFQAMVQKIHDELEEYHQLFDIYNDYDIPNLKTVNDSAGVAPVKVDERIIALLLDCKAYYELTNHKVNAAMGSILSLWHDARTHGINDPVNAALPDTNALLLAAEHMDFSCVVINEADSTVFITDPDVSLDVGAVAKGWAAQRVAENAPSGLLISVGGNVCATGPKDESGTPWVVGIQNPDSSDYLHTIYLTKGSVVTSGDYQRAYTVDGKSYHHIIDPDTLYPSAYWRSVTIVCEDSGLADALSTALFVLPQEEGQTLLDQCGAMALWVCMDGTILYSPGFETLIRT
jgi:thiamine biosynthesis lipoprotein